MGVLTEGMHRGEFLVSEANGMRSREIVTIALGENLAAGAVLGKLIAETVSVSANAGNTGNGTISGAAATAGVKEGDYVVTFVEPAVDAGEFVVEDPDGENVGTGTVGSAFSGGGITFTVNDGATDFVAGDRFTISVSGSGKYKLYDPAATDGSGKAAGVLYDAVDATGGDAQGVAVVRDAEVNRGELTWFDGASAGQKDIGVAELADLGIIAR